MLILQATKLLARNFRAILLCSLLFAMGLLLGVVGFARARRGHADHRSIDSTNSVMSMRGTQSHSPPNENDSERLTLRRTGFDRSEITRLAGSFLLSVDNRAEQGEMEFRLLRENGVRERDLPLKHDKFRLRRVIALQPGLYLLIVANHPEWVCRITVTAR